MNTAAVMPVVTAVVEMGVDATAVVMEVMAVIGLAWSVRVADAASCGGDELCINEVTGWFDNFAVWPILFLIIFIVASAYLAFDQNAQRIARNA